jgi:hypothetical protein
MEVLRLNSPLNVDQMQQEFSCHVLFLHMSQQWLNVLQASGCRRREQQSRFAQQKP